MGRLRSIAVVAGTCALIGAAPALGAFPGTNPDESVRINTPNDPKFDRAEADDETPGVPRSTNVFDEQTHLLGVGATGAPSATYKNCAPVVNICTDPHTQRLVNQNTTAGSGRGISQITGVSADRAWKRSIGRPDVGIAILDTGIRWNSTSLRTQIALNAGELPTPQTTGGAECAKDDCNDDGAFNVDDFANDPRVKKADGNDEADSILDASDLIAVFGQAGTDEDSNGYADDIAGWDFFDDDNDAYDVSSYSSASNHGTGRANEAVERTNDASGGAGVCPKCQVVPLRVWDTFVVDMNNFGMAVAYAADNDVEVVEGAIGGLFNSAFSRKVFDYAYRKGTFMAIVSSDLNSANHNIPTVYDEAMQVQGTVADVQGLGQDSGAEFGNFFGRFGISTTAPIGTWFRNSGTTQYGGHAHIVMPAVTGSQATGQAAGAAGLISSYSASKLASPLEPNEIKQLFTLTAEDVLPENTTGTGVPDPAQPGWDQHFGYGRPDLGLALERIGQGKIPPQALITGPDWFAPLNVARTKKVAIQARLSAKRSTGAVKYQLQWAPGIEPAEAEFRNVGAEKMSAGPVEGSIGEIDLEAVRAALDARPGGGATVDPTAPAKGPGDRDPNEPAFTVRVKVTDAAGNVGEDRKMLFAYRDTTLHEGWSRRVGHGGEASQRLFDMDGDNKLEVIEADSAGLLRVLRSNGEPLPSFNGGQPVKTKLYPNVHGDAPVYDGVPPPLEVQRTPAIGDIDGDREPEIVNTAGEHVHAWEANGDVVAGFPVRIDPDLSKPADRTRSNHIKRGFTAAPTLGNLVGGPALEIVAPSLDGHVYAFDGAGGTLTGFPKKLRDPTLDGAEIINTAAVGDITGDSRPEIVVPTNEVGAPDGAPGPPASPAPGEVAGAFRGVVTNALAGALGGSGRVYAFSANGQTLPGWPIKPNGILPDVLPFAGPGVDPVLGNLDGDGQLEVVSTVSTGDVFSVDGDASPITSYDSQPPSGEHVDKEKVLGLFENPITADLDGLPGLEVMKGGVTLNQLVNIGVGVGQNLPYNHVMQAWNAETGASLPAYPQAVEDFQLLSAPAVSDVSDAPGKEVLVGTGLYYLRNINSAGVEGAGWPKFTGGWIFATPTVGDADGDGKLEVAVLTREGHSFLWDTESPACGTNNEWWTSRHDEWNTGAHGTDSRPPGTPRDLNATRTADGAKIDWKAPGDDWLCGEADRYQVRASSAPIDSPDDGTEVGTGFDAQPAGSAESQTLALPDATTHVGVLYRDDAGNWGHVASVALPPTGGGGDPGGGGPGGGGPTPGGGSGTTGGGGSGGGTPGGTGTDRIGGRVRAARPCLPRRLRVTTRRIGPARLGMSLRALERRYRATARSRRAVRFCVRGGGRFLVGTRRARIDFVSSTARGHRTRRGGPGRRVRGGRVRGARRVRPGLLVDVRGRPGRVVFGLRRGRVAFVAVTRLDRVRQRASLVGRLRRLGLR